MMRRFILISIIAAICLFSQSLKAQDYVPETENNVPEKRFFFGGDFGLMFGTNSYLELSPQVGYRITNSLSAGVSATYKYYKISTMYDEYKESIYGGSVFSRVTFFRNFMLHGEIEQLNVIKRASLDERVWITNIFAGAGYRQQVAGRMYLNLLILWEINEDVNSPYSSPIFRMNFEF